jgi:hypothetical protein
LVLPDCLIKQIKQVATRLESIYSPFWPDEISEMYGKPPEICADGSGQISVGGTAQTLFSGLTPVNGYLLQNNSASVLYVSDVGTASNSSAILQLNPGVMWVTPAGYKPPGPVSIYGATSGQAYAARKW